MEPLLLPSPTSAEDIEDPKKRSCETISRRHHLHESYRELPSRWPRLPIDALVSVDAQMVNFRHRHARAVEKIMDDVWGPVFFGGELFGWNDEDSWLMTYGLRVRYCWKRDDQLFENVDIIGTLGDLTKNRDYGTLRNIKPKRIKMQKTIRLTNLW